VEARALLKTYDPAMRAYAPSDLVLALNVLGAAKNPEDAELIGSMIRYRVDHEVVLAAIAAAGTNGAGNLAQPLIEYINDFDLRGDLDGLPEALDSLARLDIAHATLSPDFLYTKALECLDRIRQSGIPELVSKASDVYLKLSADQQSLQIYRGA
jgi:hypothetical protein